jgi:hypothetical protein
MNESHKQRIAQRQRALVDSQIHGGDDDGPAEPPPPPPPPPIPFAELVARSRPDVPEGVPVSFMRFTSSSTTAGSSLAVTRMFSFTCGKRGITAAASSSVRPSSAAQSNSAAASPSPVTWSRR